MQFITISGNIGGDATLRTIQSGDKVCSFNVGAKNGFGRDAATNWFRCSLWGKRAESLQSYLLKGVKVVVTGEFTTEDYQGKQQLNIRVNDIEMMSRGEQRQADEYVKPGQSFTSSVEEDLSDSIPF